MLILYGIIVFLVLILINKHRNVKTFWKNKGVPNLEPLPLVGNFLPIVLKKISFSEFIDNISNKFPNDRYFGIHQFLQPIFVVKDPEIVKQITVKEFGSFINHKTLFDPELDPLWGNNLFASQGK